jgi:L-threonylcarbamoyladenylate synthase
MIKLKSGNLINIDENLDKAVQKAKKLYLEGSIFIHPTDTIYGFAANPFNDEAVKKIDEIKQRESDKKYILLISSIDCLLKYAELTSEKHLDFLISIWPNPVSVVLRLNKKTSEILKTKTAAFRIPNHRFCIKLLSAVNMPIVSTSVNRSNREPFTDPFLIQEEFGSEVDTIFYSEKKSFCESSTLINLSAGNLSLIREGKIKFDDLLKKFNF